MSHIRIQVRDAVKAALQTISGMSAKVFVNRVDPILQPEFPVILVFVTEEAIETLTQGLPRLQSRVLTVLVDSVVQVNATYDDAMDALGAQIEALLGGNGLDAGLPQMKDILLVAVQKTMSGEAETDTAGMRMEYRVTVHTHENNPQTMI